MKLWDWSFRNNSKRLVTCLLLLCISAFAITQHAPLNTDPTYLVAFAELELKQVEVLFNEATDNCINLKKPDQ